jgi:anti-sigma-K factor RskA
MADNEDHIALAAEYALGTLDAEERAQVETMIATDEQFAALVQAWEFRLGPLNEMVGLVEPRPIVWENIRSAIAQSAAPPAPAALTPEAPPPPAPPVERTVVVEAPLPRAEVVDDGRVVQLTSRLRRWRGVASAVSAIAAALLAVLGLQIFRPDSLPDAIRPKPRTQVVEVPAPPSGQYVAVLQQDGNSPAFILTVDAATRNFTVRRVGATPEPGKSFELWLISDKLPQPRSLGVIGAGEFTERPALSSLDAGTISDATYAVTIEQAGGSPTGMPSSAPIFSGRLIESVPPGAPAGNR